MSNFVYQTACEGIGDGSIVMLTDDIRIALVSASYTPNLTTHKFLTDLGSTIVARSGALSSKTFTSGAFDAADVTVSSVSGVPVTQIVGFKHTGSDATARLIWLIDTATGLPFTPTGGNVPVVWSNGTDKIFAFKQP